LLVILGNREAHVHSSGAAGTLRQLAAVLSRLRINAIATASRILSATRATSRGEPMMAMFPGPRDWTFGSDGALMGSTTVMRQ
jgi:hypothetical protein